MRGLARRASETLGCGGAAGAPWRLRVGQRLLAPSLPVVGGPPPPLLRRSAGCLKVSDYEAGDVRVTTAYNRMLGLAGARVRDVSVGSQAMIVVVALRRKRPVCSGCGARGLKIKDHRVKRWRHLDVGGGRCVIECRLCCRPLTT